MHSKKSNVVCALKLDGCKGRLLGVMLLFVEQIAENLDRVRTLIADAAKKTGRSLDEIELIAISKTHEAEKVRAALEAGQEIFGESRVQEARAKIPLLPSHVRWHLVGRLQKNK